MNWLHIVVYMLNAKEANTNLTYTEMSGMSVHVIMLCQELLRHKRAALIMGGRADLWNFGEEWDNMVQKNILISRTQGIMTIDGAEYFKDMEQKPGSWHMVKSESNLSKMRDMIEDTRNALYGAYPQGVFARPVPLSADDISAFGLPHDPAGAAASPLQGGLPAASSASIGSAYETAPQDSFRAPHPRCRASHSLGISAHANELAAYRCDRCSEGTCVAETSSCSRRLQSTSAQPGREESCVQSGKA